MARSSASMEQQMNAIKLVEITNDNTKCIDWCQLHNVIARKRTCPRCDRPMTLQKRNTISDGVEWRCDNPKIHTSRSTLSLRHGSWFAGSSLTLQQIVLLTYFGTKDMSQKNVLNEVDISSHTAVDWYSFAREVCTTILNKESLKIGGPGKIVQIDESKFSKVKYNVGHNTILGWVFGGVESGNPAKLFAVSVQDRTAETLLALIEKHIVAGTEIWSDGWPSYACLEKNGWPHRVVNHSEVFKAPDGTHTNAIESLWGKLKHGHHIPPYGVVQHHLQSYLDTYVWRRRFAHGEGVDNFMCFMRAISEVYNGNCQTDGCNFCN